MRRFRFHSPGFVTVSGLALALLAAHPASAGWWASDECDRLAANPFDPTNPPGVKGLLFESIEVIPAWEACKTALSLQPDNLRLQYQFGRVVHRAGQTEDGLIIMADAASKGYAIAKQSVGFLFYKGGPGIPASKTQALAWYESAARAGLDQGKRAAAQMLDAGEGVSAPSPTRAAVYWRQLAEKGDPQARKRLRAGPKDTVAALPQEVQPARRAAPPVFVAKAPEKPPEPELKAADNPPESAKAAESAVSGRTWLGLGIAAVGGACLYYSETCRTVASEIIKKTVFGSGGSSSGGSSAGGGSYSGSSGGSSSQEPRAWENTIPSRAENPGNGNIGGLPLPKGTGSQGWGGGGVSPE